MKSVAKRGKDILHSNDFSRCFDHIREETEQTVTGRSSKVMTSTCVHQEHFIMRASWPVHFTYWRSQCLPMTCLLAWWHLTCWTEFNAWLSSSYSSMGRGSSRPVSLHAHLVLICSYGHTCVVMRYVLSATRYCKFMCYAQDFLLLKAGSKS